MAFSTAAASERQIQAEIRGALSQYGVVLRLNVGTFRTEDGRVISTGLLPGTSDLVFLGDRRHFDGQSRTAFIECKTARGRATQEQIQFLRRMHSLGIRAGIARCVEDAINIIMEDIGYGI